MKWMKQGAAAVLAAAVTLSLLATALMAASKNWLDAELGDLSQYYETGNNADPGYYSTVEGDLGGTSYGIYMFASNAGTPLSFVQWLQEFKSGSIYRYMGDRLYDAYAYNVKGQYAPGYGSNFNATWRSIGDDYPEEFTQAQKDYWETHAYADLLNNLKAAVPSFDLNDYSMALRNVLWSRSVHHGAGVIRGANSSDGRSGATGVVLRAFDKLGGFQNQSEAQLIQAIYDECSRLSTAPEADTKKRMSGDTAEKYGVDGESMAYFSGNSGDVQLSVYRRLHVNEPADALVMLYANSEAPLADGDYRISPHGATDQALAANLSGLVKTADAAAVQLTYYASGYYTLSIGGKRLADANGKVTLASPTSGNDQMWQLVGDGTYYLKNRGTGRMLALGAKSVTTTSDSSAATGLQFSAIGSTWNTEGMFYPSSEDFTTQLVSGKSSYPMRGVVTSSMPISSIMVKVVSSNGSTGFTASSSIKGTAYYYDLWNLDSACAFSKLSAGQYTMTITGTNAAGTVTLAESRFTVDVNTNPDPGGLTDEEYIVAFQVGETVIESRVYNLTDTYGELPAVEEAGFQGWFRGDGTEVSPNSPVAASNHTLYAKFGDLHTVTFKVDDTVVRTFKLSKGDLVTAPPNPVKAADSTYTYSFKQWVDQNGETFTAGATYMGRTDITYTAQFTKTANSGGNGNGGNGGGTDPGTPAGAFLTGIAPETSVKALNTSGYTVYDGKTEVTSGYVGTGMTAVSDSTRLTIVVTGDVTGDGRITITDVVQLQNYAAGAGDLDEAAMKAADINGDGRITITDVVQAAQVTVGQRTI